MSADVGDGRRQSIVVGDVLPPGGDQLVDLGGLQCQASWHGVEFARRIWVEIGKGQVLDDSVHIAAVPAGRGAENPPDLLLGQSAAIPDEMVAPYRHRKPQAIDLVA